MAQCAKLYQFRRLIKRQRDVELLSWMVNLTVLELRWGVRETKREIESKREINREERAAMLETSR